MVDAGVGIGFRKRPLKMLQRASHCVDPEQIAKSEAMKDVEVTARIAAEVAHPGVAVPDKVREQLSYNPVSRMIRFDIVKGRILCVLTALRPDPRIRNAWPKPQQLFRNSRKSRVRHLSVENTVEVSVMHNKWPQPGNLQIRVANLS